MNILIITVFLLIALTEKVLGLENYCYSTDTEKLQTARYATKTAYEVVKGPLFEKDYQVPNCSPTKMWLLSRHGTRLPTKHTIEAMPDLEDLRDEIISNYKIRRSQPDTGALCPADLFALQTWKRNTSITPDKAESLTFQGWNDLIFMAKKYQAVYPNIFPKEYDENKFLFRYTDTERTEDSYRAFVSGLFGYNAPSYVKVEKPIGDDTLLKPYNYCPLWEEMNNAKDGPDSEIYKFENSKWMQDTIKNVSLRLGFKFNLEKNQVKMIFDMCRYEQAWYVDRSSSWCVAFTPEQIKVLEYNEDIKYYYKAGYGSELNLNAPCAAVKDMLTHLESETQPQSVSYFTHSVMIQMFISALGINHDKLPLRANDYEKNADRRWRVSLSGPFAANLAAIKYECPADAEKQKVMFFLNQNTVDLDWCKVGLCNWSDVIEKYQQYYKADCDKKFCNSATSPSLIPSFLILVISLALISFN